MDYYLEKTSDILLDIFENASGLAQAFVDFLGFIHAWLVFGAGDFGRMLGEPQRHIDKHIQRLK